MYIDANHVQSDPLATRRLTVFELRFGPYEQARHDMWWKGFKTFRTVW